MSETKSLMQAEVEEIPAAARRFLTESREALARRRGFNPDTPPHLRKVTETV